MSNDSPEVAENNVIIEGYVDDLTSKNCKASLTGELYGKCDFFIRKIIHVYGVNYISIIIASLY